MQSLDKYTKGVVLFDDLKVIGKDFITDINPRKACSYDYVYTVTPLLDSTIKRKKGDPEYYRYEWSGFLNLTLDVGIHLHSDDDPGLYAQEAKLIKLKEAIDSYIKEFKARLKAPGKEDLYFKAWLNDPNSRYTSFVAYNLDKNGNGQLSMADCHKVNIFWVYQVREENGKVKTGYYSQKELLRLEETSKGIAKSLAAINQLRKFFDRELENVAV